MRHAHAHGYQYRMLRKTALILVLVGIALLGAIKALNNAYRVEVTTLSAVKRGFSPVIVAPKPKQPCTSPVNPSIAAPTDCIPPHLANLPRIPVRKGCEHWQESIPIKMAHAMTCNASSQKHGPNQNGRAKRSLFWPNHFKLKS